MSVAVEGWAQETPSHSWSCSLTGSAACRPKERRSDVASGPWRLGISDVTDSPWWRRFLDRKMSTPCGRCRRRAGDALATGMRASTQQTRAARLGGLARDARAQTRAAPGHAPRCPSRRRPALDLRLRKRERSAQPGARLAPGLVVLGPSHKPPAGAGAGGGTSKKSSATAPSPPASRNCRWRPGSSLPLASPHR